MDKTEQSQASHEPPERNQQPSSRDDGMDINEEQQEIQVSLCLDVDEHENNGSYAQNISNTNETTNSGSFVEPLMTCSGNNDTKMAEIKSKNKEKSLEIDHIVNCLNIHKMHELLVEFKDLCGAKWVTRSNLVHFTNWNAKLYEFSFLNQNNKNQIELNDPVL